MLKNLLSRDRSRRRQRKTVRSNMAIQTLEKRELFVAGASFIAPAVPTGFGFDGVVQISAPGGGSCSGTLLSTGRHVLTAAHCVDFDVDSDGDGRNDRGNGTIDAGNYGVTFDVPGRQITMNNIPASNVTVFDAWTGNWRNDDIAIIELPRLAPIDAERFDIYRGSAEVGTTATLVGYGRSGQGTPLPGQPAGHVADQTKRQGRNVIDSTSNSRLQIDLDSSGVFLESVTAPGDSGGPLLLGSQIVGVSSSTSLRPQFNPTTGAQSYAGNAFNAWSAFTRVTDYQDWIDSILDDRYALTIDLDDHPVGNDGRLDAIRMSLDSDFNVVITVNGEVYHQDHFGRTRSIQIEGSNDADYFAVDSIDLWETITIDGNGGQDRLLGYSSGYVNNWTIDAANRGTLSNGVQSVDFSSIEILYGGSRNDRFKFKNWGRITGAIYGGAGTDRLDYTLSNYSVDVNLEESRATAVGYSASNRAVGIEDVYGSRFSDRIVGDRGRNRLSGNGGHDVIFGRGGSDYLYGGSGNDHLYGEEGLDYLYGQNDDDFLDGGLDGTKDYLSGGSGRDTFIRDSRYVYDRYWRWVSEELIRDLASEDTVRSRPSKLSLQSAQSSKW